jgi:transposase-like protein
VLRVIALGPDLAEEKILTLYTKGMTTRDIESALVDLYGVRRRS